MEQSHGLFDGFVAHNFPPEDARAAQGQSRYKAEKEQDTAEENGVVSRLPIWRSWLPGAGSLQVTVAL